MEVRVSTRGKHRERIFSIPPFPVPSVVDYPVIGPNPLSAPRGVCVWWRIFSPTVARGALVMTSVLKCARAQVHIRLVYTMGKKKKK